MTLQKKQAVICIAEILAKEGMIDEVLDIVQKLIPLSKSEEGCEQYIVHQSIENPNLITFVDRFTDMDAFNIHCEKDYIKKYFDNIMPTLTDSIKFSLHHEIYFK